MQLPTPAVLIAGLIFGTIGFLAFRHGKRESLFRASARNNHPILLVFRSVFGVAARVT